MIWVWSGGHSLSGLEEYYSKSVDLAPLLLLRPLLFSLLHSADAPSSLEVFFFQVFLCRSAGHIAHIQRAQSEEMVKVHPKYTKLEAAFVLLSNAFCRRGIFRRALNTRGKENNNMEQPFDFMSGGEMEE